MPPDATKPATGQTIPGGAQDVVTVTPDVETVSCDGGGGALGHPLTYYTFGGSDVVMCGYCGRRFVKAEGGRH